MNTVVLGSVCGRIAQDHQRLELGQGFHRGLTFHLLRFIQNQNRPVGGDHIYRLARLKVIQLVVDSAVVLAPRVEGLDVHHHDVDTGI